MKSSPENTKTTPENSEVSPLLASIALSGVEKVVLGARISMAEKAITSLEKKASEVSEASSVIKTSARSVLVQGRLDSESVIADTGEWELTAPPTLQRRTAESETAYQERQRNHSERFSGDTKLRTKKLDRKTVASSLFSEDHLVERAPDPDEVDTIVVKENGKVEELFQAMYPVTRKERRAARRFDKKRRQNFAKAASAEHLRATFGDHRINPNNENYDAKLENERLTRSGRKTIEKGRRVQARNIRTSDGNKVFIERAARGNVKDSQRVEKKLSDKRRKLEKLSDVQNRASDTYKARLTQLATERANRQLLDLSPEEIRQKLSKRYLARVIGEKSIGDENAVALKDRIKKVTVDEAIANLSDDEKDYVIESAKMSSVYKTQQ